MSLSLVTPREFTQSNADEALRKALHRVGAKSIHDVSNDRALIDLQPINWIDLGALAWLIPLLSRIKAQGNDIRLLLPDPRNVVKDGHAVGRSGKKEHDRLERVLSFLIRWRFFETLEACVDEPVNLVREDQIPLLSFAGRYASPRLLEGLAGGAPLHGTGLLELNPFIYPAGQHAPIDDPVAQFLERFSDRIVISALKIACDWSTSAAQDFVNLVLGEGLRNAVHHSLGSFSVAVMRIERDEMVLAVADNGLGIPGVLRQAFAKIQDRRKLLRGTDVKLIEYFTGPEMILDSHLIAKSTDAQTTSSPDRAGMGLFYLRDHVLRNGGHLTIRSGRASVRFDASGHVPHDRLPDSPGTTLRISLPVGRR